MAQSIGTRAPVTIAEVVRDFIMLFGMTGTFLTVLGRFRITYPSWLSQVLEGWRGWTHSTVRPPFDLVGISLHPLLVGPLAFAQLVLFMGVTILIFDKLILQKTSDDYDNRFFGIEVIFPEKIFGALLFHYLAVMPALLVLITAFAAPRQPSDLPNSTLEFVGLFGLIVLICLMALGIAYRLGGDKFWKRMTFLMAFSWMVAIAWIFEAIG